MSEASVGPVSYQKEFAPFWRELAKHHLSFPYCASCDKFHWYPLKRCPFCLTEAIEWARISGDAQLYSWTIVHHRFDPDSGPDVPYIIALLEFPDAPGIRLVSNLLEVDAAELEVGMALVPSFKPRPGPTEAGTHPGLSFRPAIGR